MQAALSTGYLLYFLLPLWLVAGFADWLCHRRTDIAHTSGTGESALHLLMLLEVGVPLQAALFLQINAGLILLMLACFLAHELTALWDVSMAVQRRRVSPVEQHVHSFLELIPFMAISVVCLLHWDQASALLPGNWERAQFDLRRKEPALPGVYVASIIVATLLFSVLPYLEELLRCHRAARHHQPSHLEEYRP
ncbi:diguanylate cyclase [Pseudomonas nitroreducens]|uniref:Diguanylate cyclase n=1 Tax=Pseudomonas nitroreducens TaxID=46680 RepID=A0A246F8Y0_PSENT|nr:diguanylate cyclase [Pseudomonas nitroreducens]OWP50033.1 diguanylate cyclase [Pseudomonas nitroreducens]